MTPRGTDPPLPSLMALSAVSVAALAVRFLTKRFIGEYDQSAGRPSALCRGSLVGCLLTDVRVRQS